MLSREKCNALVTVFLSRLGRVLSSTTREILEQYLEMHRILKGASDVVYFILPYPIGRIGVLSTSVLDSAQH